MAVKTGDAKAEMGPGRWLDACTAALVITGLAVIAATFRDYGITWDEDIHFTYGNLALAYFESWFADTRCNEFLNLKYYGPLFDLVAAVVVRLHPTEPFELRHMMLATMGLATVVAVARYARLFADWRIAVVAPVALIMMPRFYGHSFNNPKDIPFACLFAWAMYAIVKLFANGGGRVRDVTAAALACGLTLALRPGGFPLLALLLAAATLWAMMFPLTAPAGPSRAKARGRLVATSLAVLAGAWAVMVAPWPWAHQAVIANPLIAMREAASFSFAYPVLFEGAVTKSNELPWYYLPKYLLITTPLPLLALAAAGLIAAVRVQMRAPASLFALACFVVELWLLVPVAAAVVLRPNVYDGLRHFLFVLPAIAVAAAIGVAALLDAVAARWRLAAGCVLAVALLAPVPALVRLHPYQATFFNASVGGLAGAAGRYETDYWVSSYKEAIEWVNEQARVSGEKLNILVAFNRFSYRCAAYYLGDQVEMGRAFGRIAERRVPATHDYFISMTRYGFSENFPDTPVVHTIGRDGAVFTVIKGEGVKSRLSTSLTEEVREVESRDLTP